MPQNQLFIEFGSLATKVIETDSKVVKSILHPFNLINKDGDFNISVYNRKVFLKLIEFINENYSSAVKARGVATGIYRTARNRDIILELLNSIGILELKVLTAKQECIYSFDSYSKKHSISITQKIVYIDMGGGSTELAIFNEGGLVDYISIPIGVLNLLVNFFNGNDCLDEGIFRLTSLINRYYQGHSLFIEGLREYLKGDNSSLIITGMVVKKIHRKYRNKNLVGVEEYRKYWEGMKLAFIEYENIGVIKSYYTKPKGTLIDKTNLYLGGLFLMKILTDLQVHSFYINDKGLHHSLSENG